METANTIIVDALQELLIQASEAPIEADEAQTAIRYLNRMMAEFDAEGISLGYTNVSNLSDSITVPDGAVGGIVTNLAIRLASQYDKQVSASLAASAQAGKEAMTNIAVTILETSYPSTLPIGSGNQGDSAFTDPFYADEESMVANETGGYISIESSTDLP